VAQPKKDRFSAHPIVLAKSIISLLTSEARILEDAGFSVLEATSSDGAISYLEISFEIWSPTIGDEFLRTCKRASWQCDSNHG
jgi:hypothetical protein